jgi:acyl-CoA thioesterase
MTTTFSALLESSTATAEGLELEVPPDWMQGRSTFGGLQAAFAVRAMRAHVGAAMPLRTLQLTFVGPIAGRMQVRASVVRTGANTAHVEARVTGKEGLAAIAIGVFGRPRSSVVAVTPVRPEVPRPAQPPEMPYVPGVVPAFLQHFSARWLRGAMPFTGSREQRHVLEIDLRDDAPATEAQAIAMADFIPPLALTFLRAPANGSTLTWMLELLTDRFPPTVGWRVDAELTSARDGYTNQSLVLWAPDGTPLALGTQSMLVFG